MIKIKHTSGNTNDSNHSDGAFNASSKVKIKLQASAQRTHEYEDIHLYSEDFSIFYREKQAICNVNLSIPLRQVTAIIGPSGCGKSTFLRGINRMNDLVPGCWTKGRLVFGGEDIYGEYVDPVRLRKRVGMVFQKPNPFPKTIFDNVAFGPRINMGMSKSELFALVEKSLVSAALWDEVKDRLNDSALALSGGQQQRLCIARALAVEPEILLMDEPTSALDPRSTSRIEELIASLKSKYTIITVTHNMQQAARVSDYTAFFYEGQLIEFSHTSQLFTNPKIRKTEEYITGRFG